MPTSQPNRTDRRRRGLTLVEVVISSAVLAGILLAVGIVTKTSDGLFHATQMRDALRQRAQRTLDRIADALVTSGKSSFSPTPSGPYGSSTLDFRNPTGYAGGAVSWGGTSTLAFQYTAEDPDNGKDDDGDGFVDEGRVVLVRDTGDTTTLVEHVAEYLEDEVPNAKDDNGNGLVDERGLSFVLAGDQLQVRLTLAELDPDARPVVVTLETRVRLRN